MPESEEVIKAREAAFKKARQLRWFVPAFGVPVSGLLGIGLEWSAMSVPLAVCSIIALVVATVGAWCVMAVACEWE